MSKIIDLVNKDNIISKDNIIELTNFLDNSIEKINVIVTIRNRKINFYDLFYFIIKYNINLKSTYSSVSILFNIDINNDITTSAFKNKLISLDYKYLLNINNDFINFYYKQFNLINVRRIIAIDGSGIQLLYSLKSDFKANSSKTYTTGYISNLYDIDNNIPIAFDIFRSADERQNLITQFKYINKNDILTADRGYYSIDIINKLLMLDINFVFRVKKDNFFLLKNFNKIELIENNFSKSIKYNYNNKNYNFKILKYSNIEVIDKKYNKDTLSEQVNNNNITINNCKNKLIKLNNKLNIIKLIYKDLIKNIDIVNNRKEKNIIKLKIKNITALKLDLIVENVKNLKIIKQIINQEQSSYFILTNLNLSDDELKKIYKKRW